MIKRTPKRHAVVVVGLLAAALLAWGVLTTVHDPRTRQGEGLTELRELVVALEVFFLPQTGRYPTSDEFARGVERDYWTPEMTIDPWGKPYQYRLVDPDGAKFELFSLGADGAPGGTGLNADIIAGPRSVVVAR